MLYLALQREGNSHTHLSPKKLAAVMVDTKEGEQTEAVNFPPAFVTVSAMISSHQSQLGQIKSKLKEVLQMQEMLQEGIQNENNRFKETQSTFKLPTLFGEVSAYTRKLAYLKGEMQLINERVFKLKQRALRLQNEQQKKALHAEQLRADQEERERHLIARPVWANSPSEQL